MAKTYAQLTAQIDALRQKAEAAKKKEAAGVIARIKDAIAFYGLTAADLGLAVSEEKPLAKSKQAATPKKGKKAKARKKTSSATKYADAAGNSWSGRGPKPQWVVLALSAGKTLPDLLVDAGKTPATAAAETNTPKKIRKAKTAQEKVSSAIKYKDDAGHTWSGRGPKPNWLKDALASGKTLEDFSA